MELNISDKREKTKIVLIVAIVGFLVSFISAPFVLQAVLGITPGDTEYKHYVSPEGVSKTPYQDFLINACLTKTFFEGDETVVLDTKGLQDSGLVWHNKDSCLDVALNIVGYKIVTVEPYDNNNEMKITLNKK